MHKNRLACRRHKAKGRKSELWPESRKNSPPSRPAIVSWHFYFSSTLHVFRENFWRNSNESERAEWHNRLSVCVRRNRGKFLSLSAFFFHRFSEVDFENGKEIYFPSSASFFGWCLPLFPQWKTWRLQMEAKNTSEFFLLLARRWGRRKHWKKLFSRIDLHFSPDSLVLLVLDGDCGQNYHFLRLVIDTNLQVSWKTKILLTSRGFWVCVSARLSGIGTIWGLCHNKI